MKIKKILIIDDNMETCRLLEFAVKQMEYEVVIANSGVEAFEILEKNIPDLIIADMIMPEMDGYTFIKKLKEMDMYDNAMIVFLSDHGEEFFEHKGWAHSHSLYNELIKVPVLIKFPGSKFIDTAVNEPIGLIDMIPTILGYFDVDCEVSIDGINLMPQIRGEKNKDLTLF